MVVLFVLHSTQILSLEVFIIIIIYIYIYIYMYTYFLKYSLIFDQAMQSQHSTMSWQFSDVS